MQPFSWAKAPVFGTEVWSNFMATSQDLGPQQVAKEGKSRWTFQGNLGW